jgi:hypothetical protein|tara:strand:- start:770 stop:994 length:225 start_codon:yes stop_codon:yes gene_type:complete
MSNQGKAGTKERLDAEDIIDMVKQGLRRLNDNRINDVSWDADHQSVEVVLTTDTGNQKQTWVIRSNAVVETDDA